MANKVPAVQVSLSMRPDLHERMQKFLTETQPGVPFATACRSVLLSAMYSHEADATPF